MSALIKSRKFWLAVAMILGAGIMLGTKQIDAAAFSTIFTTAIGLVIAGIAVEDAAAKVQLPPTQQSAAPEAVAKAVSAAMEDAAKRMPAGGGAS